MITKDDIVEYFKNIQCEECPFMERCFHIIDEWNAPGLCDCVTGDSL